MKQKILFYFVLIFAFTNAQSGDTEELFDIKILKCLYDLFKVSTITELEDIGNNFTFSDASLEDITIYQFNADGSNVSVNLGKSDGIEKFHVNNDEDIIFFIHGFHSEGISPFIIEGCSYYHSIGKSNTFSVDWAPVADQFNYISIAGSTKSVGELVGKWLYNNFLNKTASLIDRVHLVGHSLGAHVSGYIGKTVQSESTSEAIIGRISGLDVAAPFFETVSSRPPSDRLNSTDAKEVDAYHTNAGCLGFKSALAKQDFYINKGGPIQPGCKKGVHHFLEDDKCSHSFSWIVYTKSINSTKPYIAKKCSDSNLEKLGRKCDKYIYAEMGEHNNVTSLTGKFYGKTDKDGNPI